MSKQTLLFTTAITFEHIESDGVISAECARINLEDAIENERVNGALTPHDICATDVKVELQVFNGDNLKSFMVHIEDSDYNEEWIRVDSRTDLAALDQDELREILGDKIVIGQEDKISVGNITASQHVVI